MKHEMSTQFVLTDEERRKRKKFLAATLITCLGLAMVGGVLHVVKLGFNRMAEIKGKASYDLSEEKSRIRAAGEEIFLQRKHKIGEKNYAVYSVDEVDGLLSAERWQELGQQVVIPAGPFTMGTDRKMTNLENQPAHQVTLDAFAIDKYPVTNAQYARFVVESGHRAPLHWDGGKIPEGLTDHPVTMVSWYDARAYCRWADKRLPTESEWEKAARGVDKQRWPWGNKMDPSRLNTYYNVGATTEVSRYPRGASPFGVFDMAGNVSEWTADDFLPYEGSKAPDTLFQAKVPKATTPADKAMKVVDMVTTDARYKVMRGGSWKGDPLSTASYHRNYSWPHYASDFYGFRCVNDVENNS